MELHYTKLAQWCKFGKWVLLAWWCYIFMTSREQADMYLQNRHSLSVEFLEPFEYWVAQVIWALWLSEVSAVATGRFDALIWHETCRLTFARTCTVACGSCSNLTVWSDGQCNTVCFNRPYDPRKTVAGFFVVNNRETGMIFIHVVLYWCLLIIPRNSLQGSLLQHAKGVYSTCTIAIRPVEEANGWLSIIIHDMAPDKQKKVWV